MNDAQIIKAFKAHDTNKIHDTINNYSPLLFYVVQNILRDKGSTEDIEECVADVFIYLWQHPDYFNSRKGTLKNYLCLIAKSKALDCYRKLSKSEDLHIPLDSLTSEDNGSSYFNLGTSPIFAQYEYEDLYKILDILSPEDREILLRRYIGGEKPSHIAKDLGVPTKSIVNNLYRSKNKLKTLITSGGNL
ncbi:MAG: sigma-70 family RNA polymerase sigma factor [Cellulosilyticum sp.]|nr:sigma-70 family RNA polymerase sigma factor [Cellulosilyticum sp.]